MCRRVNYRAARNNRIYNSTTGSSYQIAADMPNDGVAHTSPRCARWLWTVVLAPAHPAGRHPERGGHALSFQHVTRAKDLKSPA